MSDYIDDRIHDGRSGLEDAVAALETGAAVMDPADPTNMAVTAAESGRAL